MKNFYFLFALLFVNIGISKAAMNFLAIDRTEKKSTIPVLLDQSSQIATLNDFVTLSKEQLGLKMGRKLSWKEKLSFRILKKYLKGAIKKNPELGKFSVTEYFETCSRVTLRNGEVIEADIIQINPTELKYKRCGKPNDPEMVLKKSDVLRVTAPDGAILYQDSMNDNSTNQISGNPNGGDNRETPVSAIVAIALCWIPIVGIILSLIALSKINSHPEKYKGKGLAIAALIVSCVFILINIINLLPK